METFPAPEPSEAGCLIVTGMHRSGTSLLASFLRAAGINLGENLYPADSANPLGYFEDLDFLELQRKMLLACTIDESGWRDWGWTESQRLDFSRLPSFRSRAEELVRRRQAAARPWGWKDPRTTILLDFWDEILPTARYLFIYRAPWEVAASIAALRSSPFREHPGFAPRIWSFYNRQVTDFYRRHRDRCLLISVTSLLSQPDELLALVRSKLGLSLPMSQDGGAILRSLRGNGRLGATASTANLWRLSARSYPRETQVLTELEELADLAVELPLPAEPAQAPVATRSATQASPAISVVIPCFNQGEFVLAAVASVEDSEGAAFDLVIVNDGSTDPFTMEVLGRLRAVGYRILDQPNRGVSAARNAGIRVTRGRYILPLDADNRIRPSYLRRATDVLDAAPEVGVVYGDAALFGERNGLWRVPEFNLDELAAGNRIGTCAAFRRTVWEQCGGYDEDMEVGWQDWDYWLSVAETGCQFVHIPEVLLDYRVQSESMSSGLYEPQNRRRILESLAAKHAAIFQPRLPRLLAERDSNWLQAEARAALLDRSLDEVRGELEATRRDLQTARDDLHATGSGLEAALSELQAAQGELQAARSELLRWRERVEFMTGTRAWRLRSGLLRARAAFGLRRAGLEAGRQRSS
jgi:glycosyltransferase involved in cell wall biosynthesis